MATLAAELEVDAVLSVVVVPRASKSEVVGEHDGALKVRIAAPPVDGAANAELIRLLAKKLGVPKRDISIVQGGTSKKKRLKFANLSQLELEALCK